MVKVYFFRTLAAAAAMLAALSVTTAMAQDCTPLIPKSELVTEGKLTLSTNPTLPPIQYIDSTGTLKGMNIELGNEIAKRLCLQLETIRMDFPAMIPALKSGRFDGINTGMFFTEERSRVMYAVPYALSAIDIVMAPGKTSTVKSAEELTGLAIGVEADSYQERWLREREKDNVAKGRKPLKILAFPTASDVMAALRAGQLELAAFPNYAGSDFVKRKQAAMVLPAQGGSPTMMSFRSRPIAEAVSKVMTDMVKDGTYGKLLDQYGMTKLPERVITIRGPGPV